MEQYTNKYVVVAEIKRRRNKNKLNKLNLAAAFEDNYLLSFLDTLEVKDMDSIIHTIISECCDWLATNTNLSHNKIEDCRNLMLTVKEEQFKSQKGE